MRGWACTQSVSEPLFLLCFTWLSRTDVWGQLTCSAKKNKSVCRANSSNQHFWALGMWTFGRRERGKEGMRLLGKGNCVREVKTVSRLQYMRFCHSNRCRTENIGLVCTTLSVASSFVVPHHGPNWRRPSVRFWKWLWPPRHASADSCSLNCPFESCIQAKWGKWGKNCGWWNMTGQFEAAFFQLHAQNL